MEKTILFVVVLVAVEAVEFGNKLVQYPKTPIQAYVSSHPSQQNVPTRQPLTIGKKIVQQSRMQQETPNQFNGPMENIRPSAMGVSPSVAAAIQSKRFIELVGYSNQYEPVQPQVIEVEAITAPVQFVFRSASGPLLFQQVHMPSMRQEPQHTRSEEPAQLLSHEVYKPIIQELREIIQPYRHVTQEIKPVLEEVRTIVAHGEKTSSPSTLDESGASESLDLMKNKEQSTTTKQSQTPAPNLQTLPSQGIKTIQQVAEKEPIDFV